jgi:enoyl-[acyl-carrier protein] reductase II
MGTRFLATEECPIPPAYKQAILEAMDNSTMIAARRGYPIRVLKNKAALAVRRLDESGATQDEINAYVDAMAKGGGEDWENKLMSAGQIAGAIRKVLTVDELIRSMVAEAREAVQDLERIF